MALEIWTGQGRFRHTHENIARDQIISALQRRFGTSDEHVVAVFNFICGHNELDLAIFKSDGIAIVDFKDCAKAFHASKSGPWRIKGGGELKGGGRENPFHQLSDYRYGMMDALSRTKGLFLRPEKAASADFEHIKAIVAVTPNLHPDFTTDINMAGARWFHITGANELPSLIGQIATPLFHFDPSELTTLVEDVLKCRPLTRLSKTKVLICYAPGDNTIALQLKRELQFSSTMDIVCESPQLAMSGELAAHIHECDHIIAILSSLSHRDDGVLKVLDTTFQLRERRARPHPSIVAVLPQFADSSLDFSADMRERGNLAEREFSKVKRFALQDNNEDLIKWLMATLVVIDVSEGDHLKLFWQSVPVYEELFPDIAERDTPEDIWSWLQDAQDEASHGGEWRDVYTVLRTGENILGMAYISAHIYRKWCFGSYFGVLDGWRQDERAKDFLDEIVRHLQALSPDTKGIVFEVDPIDFDLLRRADQRSQVGGHDDQKQIEASLRAAKRIRFYQRFGPLVVLGANGQPLNYWQPAMDEVSNVRNERSLILMVYIVDEQLRERMISDSVSMCTTAGDVINFAYDMYKGAYGADSPTEVRGFGEYLERLRMAVLKDSAAGYRLGRWVFEPDDRRLINRLFRRSREEGWIEQIDAG